MSEIDLGCALNSIKYDFEKGVGHVYMPIGNCTDMASTIEFFQRIVPFVGHIMTWQETAVRGTYDIDTQYVKHGAEWIAI